MIRKKSSEKKLKLIGAKGWGSAIAEAFFILGNIPYELIAIEIKSPSDLKPIARFNPLREIPTVILPDGKILTETLAIAHYVQKRNCRAKLIPKAPGNYLEFYRWCVFLVSAIYPTFTYGDDPAKWVGKPAAENLRRSTDNHRKKLWKILEGEAKAPYFLGKEFSAIDVYLAAMVHWRPRKSWFKKNCPKLTKIADRVLKDPPLQGMWEKNFSQS